MNATTTVTRARDLKPGDVLTLGGTTGYVVQNVERTDGCWLRVDVLYDEAKTAPVAA